MTKYTTIAIAEFQKYTDCEYAAGMEKYMRNQFKSLGVRTPVRREIQKKLIKELGLPEMFELKEIILDLWSSEYRDMQYFAMEILNQTIKKADNDFIEFLEYLILHKSWWDSIDFIAPTLVRIHFERFPELIPIYTEKWINSENIWLQRSAILFQLNSKSKTDTELMFKLILHRKDSKEFFVQKAMGWILRQYARTNPQLVRDFVNSHIELPNLTKREAMKHLYND